MSPGGAQPPICRFPSFWQHPVLHTVKKCVHDTVLAPLRGQIRPPNPGFRSHFDKSTMFTTCSTAALDRSGQQASSAPVFSLRVLRCSTLSVCAELSMYTKSMSPGGAQPPICRFPSFWLYRVCAHFQCGPTAHHFLVAPLSSNFGPQCKT